MSWSGEVQVRLDALFEALILISPTSFRFAEDPVVEATGPSERLDVNRLVDALWPVLYERCYARTFTPSTRGEPLIVGRVSQTDRDFVAQLSSAHATRLGWNPTWRVYQRSPDGSVHVQKGVACRVALPGQYAFPADPTRLPEVGELVDLLIARESPTMLHGFYFAHGHALGCDFDAAQLTRLYFHATARAMPRLLECLSQSLNRYDVPFRLKCRDDPTHYDRADAAVLLVPGRFLAIVLRLLAESEDVLQESLKPGSPLFTKELRPGLGLAEDPGHDESFGYSRSLLMTLGIIDAHLVGRYDPSSRSQAVAARFAQAGLDPSRPYLNAGSADRYRWPDSICKARDESRPSIRREPTSFLEAADRIGRRLYRDALWAGDRCNWMTWAIEPLANRPTLVYRSAPAGLTDGVAGIALTLAQIHRLTGDRQQRIALEGATRQIIASIDGQQLSTEIGYTLAMIGELTDKAEWIERGIGMMSSAPRPEDVFASAKAIVPLLDIGLRFDQSVLLGIARDLGQNLVGQTGNQPLEIARALLELEQAFPDPSLKFASEAALAADLETSGRTGDSQWALSRTLTRLRLRELLGNDPRFDEDLRIATEAASKALVTFDPIAGIDLSLGSGLTGQAEFLLLTAESNGEKIPVEVERFGHRILEEYHGSDLPWPCGLSVAGEIPDLMLGTTGVAWFFLRIHRFSSVSSPLLIRPNKNV